MTNETTRYSRKVIIIKIFPQQFKMSCQGKIIIIEGLVGAGKTIFCKSYVSWNKNSVMLDEWVDSDILADYLGDMENKATEFQFRAQQETFENLRRAVTLAKQGKTVLLDRGLVGNRCFAEVQHEAGYISQDDMRKYREMNTYSKIVGISGIELETWYLKCDPEVALKRVASRDRRGENSYNFIYLQDLEVKHENLLTPARVIDVNDNYDLTPAGVLPKQAMLIAVR